MLYIDKIEKGKFITPCTIKNKVGGAVYDGDGELVKSSIRFDCIHDWLNKIPKKINVINNKFLNFGKGFYLGYCFEHYGHFLLECLPMLEYAYSRSLLDRKLFFLSCDTEKSFLVHEFLKILKLSNIEIYESDIFLFGDFLIAPKPILIFNKLLNKKLYRNIISRIKSKINIKKSSSKIFLQRKKLRTNNQINNEIENYFKNIGFSLIDMSTLSVSDQISIINNAEIIAGFSGSNLHNSIFMKKGLVINIGDEKDKIDLKYCYINQKICCQISETNLKYIELDNIEKMISKINKFLC